MINPTPSHDKILDAALHLAAGQPWQAVTLPAIARQAGIDLIELYRTYPSRCSIVAALIKQTDQAVLAEGPADSDDDIKDRLFDLLMRRLDALDANKPAFHSIIKSYRQDPLAALPTLPGLWQAMVWTLETAGLPTTGIKGRLYVKGLLAVYIKTISVWLTDQTDDMAKTMAALDKALDQAGHLANLVNRACPQSPRPAADMQESQT